ncbi:hypothetical protein ElyMa_006541300 [Elysia marginata]|uniref:Uncharacterized protein n=1 Tax=Elysia marginata TaxID=1093978 RepID=A0AAV4ICF3_9GAST|nr:hypothetical protein ElyMa_006541300 [Elysia marginata]
MTPYLPSRLTFHLHSSGRRHERVWLGERRARGWGREEEGGGASSPKMSVLNHPSRTAAPPVPAIDLSISDQVRGVYEGQEKRNIIGRIPLSSVRAALAQNKK